MIYQTLITACWKPHLLSWCMVMIAPCHCLPWILTNALLSSLLVSSLPRGSLFLSLSVYSSSVLLQYSQWFCLVFSVALHSVFVLLCVSVSSLFGYCFLFWAIPSMSLLIPPWYWEVGHLLFRLIPPVCLILKWKALMRLGTKLECSQTLNITVKALFSTWYGCSTSADTYTSDPIVSMGEKKESWDILLLQQIIKYRRSRITPAALTQTKHSCWIIQTAAGS